MNYSDYEIVRVEPDRVFLIDLNKGNKSLTNDADRVFHEVKHQHPNCRVIYRDSMAQWDELVLVRGEVCFKCYTEHTPETDLL